MIVADIFPRYPVNLSVDLVFSSQGPWLNLCVAAAHPLLPRVDRLVLRGDEEAVILTGTPTIDATLRNLSGVASLPADCEDIGWVLVGPSATAITSSNIRTALQSLLDRKEQERIDKRIKEMETEIRVAVQPEP